MFCESMVDEYNNLYKHFHDNKETRKDIVIAKVNCNDQSRLCGEWGIHSFPTMWVFRANESDPIDDYNGSKSLKHMLEWVHKSFPEENIEEMPSENAPTDEDLKNHQEDELDGIKQYMEEKADKVHQEIKDHDTEIKVIHEQENVIENQIKTEENLHKKLADQQQEIKKTYEKSFSEIK